MHNFIIYFCVKKIFLNSFRKSAIKIKTKNMNYYYDNNQNSENKSISFVPKCVDYLKKLERLGKSAFSMKYGKQTNDGCIKIPDSSYTSLALACMNSSPLFPIYKRTHPNWYGNRTQNSIKADRQFKEYFYHCIRNIDYPMRVNYCWDFSLKHENLFKKTIGMEKTFNLSKYIESMGFEAYNKNNPKS